MLQNVFQRKARLNLREATAGSDLEALEVAIEKFKKSKLSETDEDFLRAKRRLKYLKLKKGGSALPYVYKTSSMLFTCWVCF